MSLGAAGMESSSSDPGILCLKFCSFCHHNYVEKLESDSHEKQCPFRSAFMLRIGNKCLSETQNNTINPKFDIFF